MRDRGDIDRTDVDANDLSGSASPLISPAGLVYVLYLLGLVFGITAIAGVIIAHISKGGTPAWLETHYRYQIRTFWIGLLYATIGVITSLIAVGVLLLIATALWFIIRIGYGIKYLSRREPVPNPASWLIN